MKAVLSIQCKDYQHRDETESGFWYIQEKTFQNISLLSMYSLFISTFSQCSPFKSIVIPDNDVGDRDQRDKGYQISAYIAHMEKEIRKTRKKGIDELV